MARILGVHGVGHQYSGENTLRAEWLPALKDGLARVDQRLGSDDDFACAFYGNLFRPRGKAAVDPPFDASDVNEDWERELLELWWREAARIDPAVHGPEERTKLGTPNIVQRALNALTHSHFFAGMAERALIFDLKQVRRYLDVPEVRSAARASIERAIGSDTTVIVAHSLGSIVAYEALCAHPEWPVRTFVTIGSPLGISNLIFKKLQPSPREGGGIWPQGIEWWFNIADKGDVVALVKQLGRCFGPRVRDCLIDNGAKAHDALRYLTSKELGDAVSSGL
jgi:hypothetical protein